MKRRDRESMGPGLFLCVRDAGRRAVKRLMKEAQELSEPTEQYYAQPLDDNLFEWHFTIRGPSDSDFDGGIYHGRIILPPEYPMKPPSIILLTPNGRFETFKKICLSISGHHPESWQPSWSIRTALLAIIGFMPTHGAGALGSLDYPKEERLKLAKRSLDWKCPTCGGINYILKAVTAESEKTKQEAKELASQINFQGEKEKKQNGDTTDKKETDQQKENTQSSANQEATASTHFSPQMPPPYGQMPFTRFPFPPPFMPMPGFPPMPQPQPNSATGVPRFPPPPPFIPAMFPPGFMQNIASGQLGEGGNLFMPPWQMNPYMANVNQQSRPATESRSVDKDRADSKVRSNNAEKQDKIESQTNNPVKENLDESAKRRPENRSTESKNQSTESENENIDFKNQSTDFENPNIEPKSQSTESKNQNSESNNESAADNQASASITETESSSQNIDEIVDRGINEPAEETILRQRLVDGHIPSQVPAGRVGQSAEIDNPQQRQSGVTFSTVLIFLIGCAIALLLIRRFFLSRNWKFYYGY
ncbi:hypothetical protein FSP39_013726 [Pinctada imbricata]|uniref:UBC core domain-containing protein n=1 Tax=Pinctada imbricata TaxID=66713 RepID=A0AA89BVM5_PINIB|nr:hypothetical protein FSP39_013726 [Pinctada imbricata]